MKRIIFSFGAVVLLASFSSRPAQISGSETVQFIPGPGLMAKMTGTQAARGGEANAHGYATFNINPGKGTITYFMEVYLASPATSAALHFGAAGAEGPVVAQLNYPLTGATQGVITVDKDLAKLIHQNPQNYYLTVGNSTFPAGAIRGQLSK